MNKKQPINQLLIPDFVSDPLAQKVLSATCQRFLDDFHLCMALREPESMLYEIVPPGYEFVLVKGDGLRFFAAACSFLARLSARVPAACLAEQLIANAIVDRAQDKLAKMEDCGDITRGQRISASGSLNGVYEFVGDDFSILFEVEARTSDEDLIFELFEPLDEELSIGLMRALSPE